MDFPTLISQLNSHMSVTTIILFVLIVAEEVVANLPFIKANSVGQMLLSAVSALLSKVWSSKTSS